MLFYLSELFITCNAFTVNCLCMQGVVVFRYLLFVLFVSFFYKNNTPIQKVKARLTNGFDV